MSVQEKRSAYAPPGETPVRYDGIYRIAASWRREGAQNLLMCRYLFVRCDNEPAPWSSESDSPLTFPTREPFWGIPDLLFLFSPVLSHVRQIIVHCAIYHALDSCTGVSIKCLIGWVDWHMFPCRCRFLVGLWQLLFFLLPSLFSASCLLSLMHH